MFDTHCHLFDKAFKDTLEKVIIKARDNGVTTFMIPATSMDTSKEAIKISTTYQNVYASVGIHPTEKLDMLNMEKNEKALSELCTHEKVLAIGETGLDYYRFESSPDIQQKYFLMHIKLAIKYEKALIIHCRQSTDDLLKLLNKNWQDTMAGRVVFHCASFESDIIDFANTNDCYLGVDGDITYDKFKQEQIKKVKLEKIVIETDSPYLLPEPLKTQKLYPNTPTNLTFIADYLAKLLQIDTNLLKNITTNNATRLFDII